jgi:hypothetical protein
MTLLWNSFLAWKRAEEEAIAHVKVLCCTVDVALKGFAKQANYPAKLLFRLRRARAAVLDELQRIPEVSLIGVAAHVQTIVGIGDEGQRVCVGRWLGSARHVEFDTEDRTPSSRAVGARESPLWADELLCCGQGRQTLTGVWHLMETKRCGEPLVTFVKQWLPEASRLRASKSLNRTTFIRHVFYRAEATSWWNFEGMGGTSSELWCKNAVLWQSGLFISLATRILQQLAAEVAERKQQGRVPLFGKQELLIFVGMSLSRLLRSFELFIRELLSWARILKHLDLEDVTEALVSCRQPNDSTGPTFKYGYVVRHPRYRRRSAVNFEIAETQITGVQTDTNAQYIQLTRATHETVVYMHDLPCGTPQIRAAFPGPPAFKVRWDRMNKHLDVLAGIPAFEWTHVDCHGHGAPQPVFVKYGWADTASLALWSPRAHPGC